MKTHTINTYRTRLERAGLTAEFVRFCRDQSPDDEMLSEWSALNNIAHPPKSFRDIRRALGCRAPHGGLRAGGGRGKFYSVRGLTA